MRVFVLYYAIRDGVRSVYVYSSIKYYVRVQVQVLRISFCHLSASHNFTEGGATFATFVLVLWRKNHTPA